MTAPWAPDTPAVVIDLEVVERNILRAQAQIDALGIAFRPHIKTHKLPAFARRQIDAGAVGITCQKIGEAEVMADAGISDILITYNILGAAKLERLARLAKRCSLIVTADNDVVVKGLSARFEKEPPLRVLVECDTGHARCGVQTPEHAVELARLIANSPGLQFHGLMTYPAPSDMKAVNAWLERAMSLLDAEGIACPVVSCGGTPNLASAGDVTVATEHRAGTYIYNDRSLIEHGAASLDDCALTVKATVVSRPTRDRAVIDAGSKALTSDLLGLTGYGLVVDAPDAVISNLSEEHGVIELAGSDWNPSIGDVISIIPNHACVVSNLADNVHIKSPDGQVETVAVAARGRVS